MNSSFSLFPHQASTMASRVDGITIGLLVVCGLVAALVFGLVVGFAVIYRKGSPRSREIGERGANLLEWSWTIATFLAFLVLFVWAAVTFFQMHDSPRDAAEITVVAKQWMWKFQHPDGQRELNELHVPVGRPIVLVMTSEDVIHSLFIPEFRIKQDVVPGRYTRVWFEATRPGEYHLFCTQYCGTLHAGMLAKVVVMPGADYQKWLETGVEGARFSAASRGARLFTRMGCISCHGVNPGVRAPTLDGLFGNRVGFSDGTSLIADENYIRESILNPRAKIVQGYRDIMPSYTGLIGEEDVLDLIAYVKTLSGTPASVGGAGGARALPTTEDLPSPPPLRTGDPR